jgi:putative ABC transport system substrate-binding protein
MKRRELITLLCVSAAAWPLTVRAQRDTKIRHVGVLANEKWPPIDGLRDGLRGLGYVEGQNLDLVHRYVEGEGDDTPPLQPSWFVCRPT